MNTNTTNKNTAEVVTMAINGMEYHQFKNAIMNHIGYVPGCDDEYIRPKMLRGQAIEIYHAIFSEIYEEITGNNDEKAPSFGDNACNAVERIYNMLDKEITVRGIYRVWDSTGVRRCINIFDNITYKNNHIYTDSDANVTMGDIDKWSEGVDVCLVGDDIKKELGM